MSPPTRLLPLVALVRSNTLRCLALIALSALPSLASAHNVDTSDAAFLQAQSGIMFWPYLYLGAKHMVTGLDHLLFLAGVVFFLRGLRDVAIYVSLFALGHSLTLILGVMFELNANPYLVDAVIGLSVVYKALENLAQQRGRRFVLDTRAAVFIFGLCHGLGLATKLQQITLPEDGLLMNLLAFNLGVEVGQLLALSAIVLLVFIWRQRPQFSAQAAAANWLTMTGGFLLMGIQLSAYWVASAN